MTDAAGIGAGARTPRLWARGRLAPTARLASAWLAAAAVCAVTQAQPVPLDDQGLAGVTASTAAPLPGPAPRGPDTATAIVVDAASARGASNVVRLEDDAQASARALNAVNAAAADVAHGVNVAGGRGAGVGGASALRVDQRNDITRTARTASRGGRFVSPASVVERTRQASGAAAESSRREHRVGQTDLTMVSRSTTTRLDASVVPESVGLFDKPVSLGGQEIALPSLSVDFGSIDVAFTVLDLPGEDADVEIDTTIDVPTLTIPSPTLRLGEVTLEGDDVVLASPMLTLPSSSFSYCFLDCDSDDPVEPTLTIPERTFSLGTIRLEDANPLGDLGLSFGYAIAGDGTIGFDAGGIEFEGALALDIGLLENLDFGLEVPGVKVFEGLLGDLDPPSFEIPVDEALDFPSPAAFDREIDGQVCTYSEGRQGCGPLDRSTERVEYSSHASSETTSVERSQSEAHLRFEVEKRRGELKVEQGRADLVVLRNSTAEDERYSVVVIGGAAQSGLGAANAVNAATAIVGNGLNVVATPSASRQARAGTRSTLSQRNSIRQVGGL